MQLTKEQVLGAEDLKPEKVPVPEWGGHVYVRVLTAAEALAFHGVSGGGDAFAQLVALTVCDERGARLFTDEDAAALARKSHVVMQRLMEAAMRVNNFQKEQKEELKNG